MLERQKPDRSSSNSKRSVIGVAVVICTHNRPAALERCLERLQRFDSDFSVVVVDSAPTSSRAKSIAACYGAQYSISPLKGLSRARNIGTCATDADIIAYLDDDMLPHERWLASLIAEFADKDVLAATGPVLPLEYSDGSDVDLQLAIELQPWGPQRFQVDQSSRQWFERTNFGGIGDGNFAMRRSAFEQMQGFDERLGRGAAIDSSEEHYGFFKLVELGFKIAYAPHAIVFHPSSTMSPAAVRKQIADTVAFATFLAWNHPSRSWRVAKFFIEGIFHVRRRWHPPSRYEDISIPAREKFVSALNGLSIFFRSPR